MKKKKKVSKQTKVLNKLFSKENKFFVYKIFSKNLQKVLEKKQKIYYYLYIVVKSGAKW